MTEEKHKLQVSVDDKTNSRLEDYAEKRDESVTAVVKDMVETGLDKCDAKAILKKSCETGEEINPESKICKNIEKHFEH